MKRIIFVLGILGVMGLASSFSTKDQDTIAEDGCGGGSRVCCSSPGQNHP